MKKEDIQFAKFVVLVNGLVPAGLLLWDVLHDRAGVNPINYAEHTTGMLALMFLMLSLLMTPLRMVTGIGWLFYFRRSLGLFAFFYAVAHLLIFFVFERGMSISGAIGEMAKREYLIYGSLALLLMVPLAATSTQGAIRWLGSKRWQRLHKLVYVAALLAVIHFGKQVKADFRLPMAFMAVLAVLLGFRVGAYLVKRARSKGVAAA